MTDLPEPLRSPVHVAPMAGGPSTPALVVAAARAGHFAQLAAGYRTPDDLAAQIAEVRTGTDRFGVNLFAPNPVPIDPADYERYRASLGVEGLPDQREDDDAWTDKVALLLDDPVPVVSFTFGLPDADLVWEFRKRETITMQSVTNRAEALAAAERGVDVLVVQGEAAGGHSAVLDPASAPVWEPLPDLVRAIRHAVELPVIAAGGIGSAADVEAVRMAGADAAMVGTLVLRTHEAGTGQTHRDALVDPVFDRTALTRAFTGRPARALVNRFVREHEDAPLGYPALHHLTRPIRTAAAAAGDAQSLHLWAGRSWRAAADAPLADVLEALLT
ncbi:nitronate monooxygenase [Microbacterium sp. M1A1_1b]|uniref:nitronate monooxygenase n=1 Tax=Curtobacterium sp. VKM Ac-2922 TaxID=2929475 RepID=UPI001FB38895|nr:nitronate monooxygenase [Curtobacterium sp. VKM Ac-2922]MCJ1714337.1 nitronate monooxygenase [Curtobacterium sp. VKM Ac-2922]